MASKPMGILQGAVIGLLIVAPFMALEWINRRILPEAFPYFLFFVLWLLASLFIFLALPIMQYRKAGNKFNFSMLLRIFFLLVISWFWAALVIDQVPCFLGQYNCD